MPRTLTAAFLVSCSYFCVTCFVAVVYKSIGKGINVFKVLVERWAGELKDLNCTLIGSVHDVGTIAIFVYGDSPFALAAIPDCNSIASSTCP